MKVGEVYFIIHEKLKEKTDKDNCIDRKKMFAIFGYLFGIPKSKKHIIMNEMIEFGMFRKVNSMRLLVLD